MLLLKRYAVVDELTVGIAPLPHTLDDAARFRREGRYPRRDVPRAVYRCAVRFGSAGAVLSLCDADVDRGWVYGTFFMPDTAKRGTDASGRCIGCL